MLQTNNTDTLTYYRTQIDALDQQLMELLGKRMQVVEDIGRYKAANNMPALQQSRFDALLQKNIEIGALHQLSAELITEVMHAIHREALRNENEIHAEFNAEVGTPVEINAELAMSNAK